MEKKFSSEVPTKVVQSRKGYVLSYNVREATEEEILAEWKSSGMGVEQGDVPTGDFVREHRYVYNVVDIPLGQWKYDGIINAIVRDKYRSDQMEAITNNMAAINAMFMQVLVTDGIIAATKYLKDSVDEENSERFREMQEWRVTAKKVANEVIAYARKKI